MRNIQYQLILDDLATMNQIRLIDFDEISDERKIYILNTSISQSKYPNTRWGYSSVKILFRDTMSAKIYQQQMRQDYLKQKMEHIIKGRYTDDVIKSLEGQVQLEYNTLEGEFNKISKNLDSLGERFPEYLI